ncbi:hypothetical protein GCM10009868_19800 [Terrabacter aerolatus]|uniref:Uncharacterized protein n=1 Tax=Terrabacter aerolatus TaxID=422442 RepID=A0A512D064_9MICO|nr:hypothetical protein TAE01_16620 [Terrabacter aerolatus]
MPLVEPAVVEVVVAAGVEDVAAAELLVPAAGVSDFEHAAAPRLIASAPETATTRVVKVFMVGKPPGGRRVRSECPDPSGAYGAVESTLTVARCGPSRRVPSVAVTRLLGTTG